MTYMGISNRELRGKPQISVNIIPRMKRDGYVFLDTAENIRRVMGHGNEDILEFAGERAAFDLIRGNYKHYYKRAHSLPAVG